MKISPRIGFFTGLGLFFLRIAVGIMDGSFSLVLLGAWGLYEGIFLLLPSGRGTAEPEHPPKKEFRRGEYLLKLLFATFGLGMILEAGKECFRIYMEFENKSPGWVSLVITMATLLIWEGGILPEICTGGDRKFRLTLDLLFSSGVFLILGGICFIGPVFSVLESAASVILAFSLMMRTIPGILGETQQFFPFPEKNRQA